MFLREIKTSGLEKLGNFLKRRLARSCQAFQNKNFAFPSSAKFVFEKRKLIAANVRPLHDVADQSEPSSLCQDKTFFVKTERSTYRNLGNILKRRLAEGCKAWQNKNFAFKHRQNLSLCA